MDELDSRQRDVLGAIVQEHINTGEPVGSSAIAGRDLAVSSATVRSVMADLEELGYLEKPHTSAGRVPTERGYRYFVDTLVQLRPPSRNEREVIDRGLPGGVADEILRGSSRLLSALSHHAAVVTVPGLAHARWDRVEFLHLREDRILAILVSPGGLVRNRLLTLEFAIDPDELARAAAYLNELLAKEPMEVVRERLLAEIARERTEYDALATKAHALGRQLFADRAEPGSEVVIEGQESFFEAPEFGDLRRMRELFRALEEKSKLVAVLDRTLEAGEMQIFIGTESEFSAATGTSVVAAPYGSEAGVIGSIGIIGPTRMDYSRAIGLVDYTARVVSRLLQRG